MCLKSIDRVAIKPAPKVAWKIFRVKTNRCLGVTWQRHRRHMKFPVNKWMDDPTMPGYSIGDYANKYISGFHAYRFRKSAKMMLKSLEHKTQVYGTGFKYACRKVLIDKITAMGIQDGKKCVVFRKMFITKVKA